jgi:hypothetical protein
MEWWRGLSVIVRDQRPRGKEGADDDMRTIYIGESDVVWRRMEAHYKRRKQPWEQGVVFVSTNEALNKAWVRWLEYELIRIARDVNSKNKRYVIENDVKPHEPFLGGGDKANARFFLRGIRLILPLVGVHALEKPERAPIPATSIAVVPQFDKARAEHFSSDFVITADGKPAYAETGGQQVDPAKFARRNRWPGPKPMFDDDQKIKILAKENPKCGSAAKRFDLYKSGMTVAEALKAGLTRAGINWDVRHNFILISRN